MKTLIFIACIVFGVTYKTVAQDEVAKAAKEACSCLKELDPEKLSKRDLSLSLLGCMSRQVDVISQAMKKRNAWSDTLTMTYLGKLGKETRALCPQEFERLKKKEVILDPALLAIKPEAELVSGFSQAVCNCLGVIKEVDQCMEKVGIANEAELKKRMPDKDPLTLMMGVAMDVMFDLADHCDLALSNPTVAQFKKFPAIKEGCSSVVMGEFSTKTMLGETRSKFTATKLQEYTDGKLTAEYDIKWTGCNLVSKCTASYSESQKKGEEQTMEIRRASDEGFIAFVSFGKMKVPVFYNKVK